MVRNLALIEVSWLPTHLWASEALGAPETPHLLRLFLGIRESRSIPSVTNAVQACLTRVTLPVFAFPSDTTFVQSHRWLSGPSPKSGSLGLPAPCMSFPRT